MPSCPLCIHVGPLNEHLPMDHLINVHHWPADGRGDRVTNNNLVTMLNILGINWVFMQSSFHIVAHAPPFCWAGVELNVDLCGQKV
jgi:hypothetical protein